jgi:hypothetical protein
MAPTKYNAHETARMRELDGTQLASFGRRAVAFSLDLAVGWLSFMLIFVVVLVIRRIAVGPASGPPIDDAVHLTFFENWYSVCGGSYISDWQRTSGTGEHRESDC